MQAPFIDLHCHPTLKPYGQSFRQTPVGINSKNRRRKNSIWHYDPPNVFERALQMLTGISKFTQADCATLAYGNARIVCASLYPIEKGFFNNELGTGSLSDLTSAFVTSVGRARVDQVQQISNYFEDLERERDFMLQLSGQSIQTDAGTYRYIVTRNYAEIEQYMEDHPREVSNNTVFIILTIEGLHVLNSNYGERGAADASTIMANLERLKNWSQKPFFVTFAHHFYNHLCGHARSLTSLVGNMTNQLHGMNEPFTPLGLDVVRRLLDTNGNGRIYIDIKHMSAASRRQYLQLLQTEYTGEDIPVIVSHGACNGLHSYTEARPGSAATSHLLLPEDINFFDDEILALAMSGGIFGLQLDERRIASRETLRNIKHAIPMNKIRHYRAELLWNQVRHIVELLDRHGRFAWDSIAIGSDFDGVINPLNGYLTAETFPHLLEYLERYIFNYMESSESSHLNEFNRINPSEAVNRIFSGNAAAFLRRWYH